MLFVNSKEVKKPVTTSPVFSVVGFKNLLWNFINLLNPLSTLLKP